MGFQKTGELEFYFGIKQMESEKETEKNIKGKEGESVTIEIFSEFWKQLKEPELKNGFWHMFSPVYVSVLLPAEGEFLIPLGFKPDDDMDVLQGTGNFSGLIRVFKKIEGMECPFLSFINITGVPMILQIQKDDEIAVVSEKKEGLKQYRFENTSFFVPGFFLTPPIYKPYLSVAKTDAGYKYYAQFPMSDNTLRDPILREYNPADKNMDLKIKDMIKNKKYRIKNRLIEEK